jgi:hypothetical protein
MPEESANQLRTNDPDTPPEDGATLAGNPRGFTLWQRVQIAVASVVGYLAVYLVGRSLRFEIRGWENWEAARQLGKGLIYTTWHRELFAGIWFWRKRGIVAMASQNFDGEYVARIIRWHGYGAARGSSSRGAGRALVEMIRCHRAGRDTVLTIDGPRGPRFVAKRGAVILSRATGATILCFHIAVKRAYVFRKSWDQTQIPYPFTRAVVFIAPPIVVPEGASEADQVAKQQEVQRTLDELRARGEEWLAGAKREIGN